MAPGSHARRESSATLRRRPRQRRAVLSVEPPATIASWGAALLDRRDPSGDPRSASLAIARTPRLRPQFEMLPPPLSALRNWAL